MLRQLFCVPARLDLADFFWPMKAYTAERLRSGTIPLWNPLSACGEPWLAQLQTGVLYPPDLVFLLSWPWGPWVALLLHAIIGAAGMAAYLRDLGSSRGAAVAAGGLFVASAGAGLLLAAGITCAVAWPFAELVKRSGRLEDVSRQDALARPVGAGDVGDLVAPPRDEATRSVQPGRGGYLVSLAGTPLAFLLAAGAGAGFPGRRRLVAGWALLGALGLLASLGAHGAVIPALHAGGLLPGVRFPARWFVFAHLALCVAAGAGWDGWLHGQTPADDPQGRLEARASRVAAAVALAALDAPNRNLRGMEVE